jgi:hypothetical protein
MAGMWAVSFRAAVLGGMVRCVNCAEYKVLHGSYFSFRKLLLGVDTRN